ncbi:MAG: LPS export ABC transporter permease LptF [Bdellovibrio bacteriovorus]
MLQILDRYLIFEVLKTFLAIVFVLLLIVASLLFLRILEELNLGAMTGGLVLRFLGLQLVSDISSLLPPAYFIAMLATLTRFARDSELIALSACGIGPRRVYWALLLVAVPISLVTAWFSLVLQPDASAGIAEIRYQMNEQASQIAGLRAGRFYVEDQGKLVVYIGAITRERGLERVLVLDRRQDRSRLVVSATGRHSVEDSTGDHLVTLSKGHRFDGTPGEGAFLIGRFDEYQVRIRGSGAERRSVAKRSAVPSPALLGTGEVADQAELEHRLAAPLAIFVLAVIAVPLVAVSPRQRASGRLLLAFLVYFSFFNLQRLAETWLANGTTPPWLGSLWHQVLVLALVYLILAPDSLWFRRLRERLRARPQEQQLA